MSKTAAGAVFGLVAYGLVLAFDALQMLLNPFLWERVTFASLAWTVAYAVVFAAAGVVCAWLSYLRVRLLRFALTGAVVGALVWSYATATWAFTVRAYWMTVPTASVSEAVMTGAVVGAVGGLIFYLVALLRP